MSCFLVACLRRWANADRQDASAFVLVRAVGCFCFKGEPRVTVYVNRLHRVRILCNISSMSCSYFALTFAAKEAALSEPDGDFERTSPFPASHNPGAGKINDRIEETEAHEGESAALEYPPLVPASESSLRCPPTGPVTQAIEHPLRGTAEFFRRSSDLVSAPQRAL